MGRVGKVGLRAKGINRVESREEVGGENRVEWK